MVGAEGSHQSNFKIGLNFKADRERNWSDQDQTDQNRTDQTQTDQTGPDPTGLEQAGATSAKQRLPIKDQGS